LHSLAFMATGGETLTARAHMPDLPLSQGSK
jgi:hypothetical protein